MRKDKTYIICEIGVNHNGDFNVAKQMIDEAFNAGCSAVKFQAYKTSMLVKENTKLADYQKENVEPTTNSQYEMLKNYELSEEQFFNLENYTQKIGLDFLVTPFDSASLLMLKNNLNLKVIKISSSDLNNYPLIKEAIGLNLEMILSTGMATLSDIKDTIKFITKHKGRIAGILHCTTSYPTNLEEVNLNIIDMFIREFPFTIGYSDHTIGDLVPISAVAKGARIIEKHVTLSKNLPGPDHKASMEFDDLKHMIDKIRNLELALGIENKQPTITELKNKVVAIKKIHLKRDISMGEVLQEEDLYFLRANDGIEVKHVYEVIGKKANMKLIKDSILNWDMISSD
jgi:sialic acid synthase SpsE